MAARLVEEIADGRTERAGQDEGDPEQQHARHVAPEIQAREHCQPDGEDQCAALVAEPRRIRHPVAKRGSESLRKGDRGPVEGFDLRGLTVSTEIVPSDQYQRASEASTQPSNSDEPP